MPSTIDFAPAHWGEPSSARGRWDTGGDEDCWDDDDQFPDFEEIEAPENWSSSLHEAISKLLASLEARQQERQLFEGLHKKVRALETKLGKIEKASSLIVPVTTFAPEPFDVLKEIKVVVQCSDDESTATFFDANINAAGCNESEAVENLKDLILSRFLLLSEETGDKLSPSLARQIAVLREFVRRRD